MNVTINYMKTNFLVGFKVAKFVVCQNEREITNNSLLKLTTFDGKTIR